MDALFFAQAGKFIVRIILSLSPWHILLPIPFVGVAAIIWMFVAFRHVDEICVPMHIKLRPDLYDVVRVDTLQVEGQKDSCKCIYYRKKIKL